MDNGDSPLGKVLRAPGSLCKACKSGTKAGWAPLGKLLRLPVLLEEVVAVGPWSAGDDGHAHRQTSRELLQHPCRTNRHGNAEGRRGKRGEERGGLHVHSCTDKIEKVPSFPIQQP